MKIGIDIGGSHIGVAAIDEKGKIIEKLEKDIQKSSNIKENIVNYVDEAISKFSKIGDIEYIGIAAPGNPNGSKINNIVNLGIKDIDFKNIEEKYHIKIKSINDGKAAALAEKKYGSMKEYKDGVFLCLGTGIGGAVFLNDILLKANRNTGFELGHMIIDKNGTDCNCGKRGCFETYCSIKRFKVKVMKELEKVDYLINNKNSSELVQMVKENRENEKIKEMIEEYIDNLIIGLSNIIDIFEPEIISLGGSFVYFESIFYKKLIEQMEQRKHVFNKEKLPKIVLATLGNNAGLIGATLI